MVFWGAETLDFQAKTCWISAPFFLIQAGAHNSIQDAGALRAPAPTKDFSEFCNDFFEFWVLMFDEFLIVLGDSRG